MSDHVCAHCGGRVADEAERCPSCGSSQRVSPGSGRASGPSRHPRSGGGGPIGGPSAGVRRPAIVLALLAGVVFALTATAGAVVFLAAAPVSPLDAGPAGATTTPGVAAEAASGGFAAVRARGKLRVAADPNAAPFLAPTADGWEGFEYGVMSALAAEAGVPLEVVPASYSELPDALRRGAADLGIGQLSPSAWRDVAWSVSYLQYSLCLVVPSGSRVRALSDLRGKRVGMFDDRLATAVTTLGVGADYERVVFDDYGYFDQLAKNELAAVVYDCPLARHELTRFGKKLVVADDALNVATYNVAVPAADPALKADVNRVLRRLGEQGLLARLESRWLGAAAPTDGYTTGAGRVVVVNKGETLRSIAARELGSEDRWTELHERNRDLVGDDPHGLYAGLRLRVEGAPEPIAGSEPRRRPRPPAP